jgi:hypothetical protein
MSYLSFFLIPAILAAPPARSAKDTDTAYCAELMAMNTAKMDSTQNIEMRMIAKDGDWRSLRSRLQEISEDRTQFWLERVAKTKANEGVSEYYAFARASYLFRQWKPGWTSTEKSQAILNSSLVSLEVLKQRMGTN